MPVTKVNIQELLELKQRMPLLDVRSPGEYGHAHIPGALPLPLFTNDERRVIGTAYKQESREKAIKIGLEAFGKNMVAIVEQVEKILSQTKNSQREVALHCWRGGMRSAAVAWLLDLYGFKVYTLQGGYKAYRSWVLKQFEKPWRFQIVGGYTGSNKTGVIGELKRLGEAVIDLEALAGHSGSAFGNLDRESQPAQELFENLLAGELVKFEAGQQAAPIWLEDESQRIGAINLPHRLFDTIRTQDFFFLEIPFEQRLAHIVQHYGRFDKEKLINAIVRIKKRLGGLEAKQAVNCLLEDDVAGCFDVLLTYYDRVYLRNRASRHEAGSGLLRLASGTTDAAINAKLLIRHVRNN